MIHQVKTGDFVYIPKGIPHTYNSGPKGGKVLVISPAGLEKYFTEVASLLSSAALRFVGNDEVVLNQ